MRNEQDENQLNNDFPELNVHDTKIPLFHSSTIFLAVSKTQGDHRTFFATLVLPDFRFKRKTFTFQYLVSSFSLRKKDFLARKFVFVRLFFETKTLEKLAR